MADVDYEEMKKIVQENLCAVCGGELTIRTNPDTQKLEVWCPHNPDHHGYVERETYTQAMRRGAIVPLPVQAAIERKMMPKDDLVRAMNLLAVRYPKDIRDAPTAALFIRDCARLDLDPLIQPAEAVPVAFKSHKIVEGKKVDLETVSMIITEDGWLSMAARGCRGDWVGPPSTMRLEEYLTTLKQYEGKTPEEIEKIARAIKKSACKDEEAWYYVAIGKRQGGEDAVVPGWFTTKDFKRAESAGLPAFHEPGNQARVRAIKKWVRHVFPECRQRMIALTKEWIERAEGIQAAQEFIDAEYRIIESGEIPGQESSSSIRPEGDGKGGDQVEKESVRNIELAQTPFSSQKGKKKQISVAPGAEALPPTEIQSIEGEGFSIDLAWLKESQELLRWTDATLLSFLAAEPYKVTGKTVIEALSKLTREKAERFTREINDKTSSLQPELFH